MTLHKNVDLKLELVRYALKQGIRKASRSFQCSRNTVRLWLRRYTKEGPSGLRERSKAPKRIPHKTPIHLEQKVIEAKERAPHYGTRRLKEVFSLEPSVGTINRILRQRHLTRKPNGHSKYQGMGQYLYKPDLPEKGSPVDTKLYKSLGHIIKDYRKNHQLSQETLAELVGISVRELQRWETDRRRARIENLHDLSEITGIPMQVCLALNADQPVWYALRGRWFAYSSIEVEQFVSTELLRYCELSEGGILTKNDRITTDRHMSMILSCQQDIYGAEKPLGREVIKTASKILPDVNRIFFDSWGHYVGHIVCLPIKMEVYEQIKRQKAFESYLTTERICDIIALHEGVLFFYSIFAASVSVNHSIMTNNLRYFAKIDQKESYLVVSYAPTIEAKKVCHNLGLKRVPTNTREHEHTDTEMDHGMYEIELDALMKRFGPFEALGWVVEKKV